MTEHTDPPRAEPPGPRRRRFGTRWLILAAIGGALATVGIAALLTSVFQHQQEARNPFYRVVALDDSRAARGAVGHRRARVASARRWRARRRADLVHPLPPLRRPLGAMMRTLHFVAHDARTDPLST